MMEISVERTLDVVESRTGSLSVSGGSWRNPMKVAASVGAASILLLACSESPQTGGIYGGVDASLSVSGDSGTNGTSTMSTDSGTTTGSTRSQVDSGLIGFTDAACASVMVGVNRVTPTVILIVDQSGSMTGSFGNGNRWDTLRDAILDSNGLIQEFQDEVRFGVSFYTGPQENGNDTFSCPRVVSVAPALSNFDAIDTAYAMENPLSETPTGESIDAILDQLEDSPDPDNNPVIFILATDGEPDTCAMPNPQRGQAEAIAAVERAYSLGIRTYALSVGNDVGMTHLQDIANAGLGVSPGDPDAPFWVASENDGLRSALRTIIGGQRSCQFKLEGSRIDPTTACEDGEVHSTTASGALVCGTDWRAVDGQNIELLGQACDDFLSTAGASIRARFDCPEILF